MKVTKDHVRHIMLYEYNMGHNATLATKNIREVYGNEILSVSQCQRWFLKFRTGNYSLTDKSREGRPVEFDDDLLRRTVEHNPSVTVGELSDTLNARHSTVHRHLKTLGYVSKLGKWVQHE